MNPRSIFDGQRVVHPKNGRGEVKVCWPDRMIAVVQFDDFNGMPAQVLVRDLVDEPADMPPPSKPELRVVAPHVSDIVA